MDIQSLSEKFGVNAERGEGGNFPGFLSRVKEQRVLVITDGHTMPLSKPIVAALRAQNTPLAFCPFEEEEPVADENTVERARRAAEDCDYLLAVGAGTLNDVAKYAGHLLGKPSGVFATAPSMDGFTSGVTPLIEGGFKITRNAQVARDVLMDQTVLSSAPAVMIGAGVGDILAKYCCLADWRLSASLTGEAYNEEAASLMYEAVRACDASIPALIRRSPEGTEKLMDALLVSGYAMVIAGSSRPASGAEHHMSHFLEMDFLRRKKRIPLHGVKVGLGTMVSLYLYHTAARRPAFAGQKTVAAEAEKLPAPEEVEHTLAALGCPTRFSELDVSADTVRAMLREAYKIRDRFTILTLYCTYGLMTDAVVDELMERFY